VGFPKTPYSSQLLSLRVVESTVVIARLPTTNIAVTEPSGISE